MKLYIVLALSLLILLIIWIIITNNTKEHMEKSSTEIYTPLVVKPLTYLNNQIINGTDGNTHILYELLATNYGAAPSSLNVVDIMNENNTSLLKITNVENNMAGLSSQYNTSNSIVPGETKIIFIELSIKKNMTPKKLIHYIEGTGSIAPGDNIPKIIKYFVEPFVLNPTSMVFVDSPLRGKYSMINACCVSKTHRRTVLPINNKVSLSQRFALDIIRMNDNGEYFNGDPKNLQNWICYGNNIYSMTAGTVHHTNDGLNDQLPGSLPDPSQYRSTDDVLGNSIVIQYNNMFILYAHLVNNSLRVKKGDIVYPGQLLGKLGNSGNSSGPHLHIHICDSPLIFGSNGIGFGFKNFIHYGNYDIQRFDNVDSVTELIGNNILSSSVNPTKRMNETPMQGDIVIF